MSDNLPATQEEKEALAALQADGLTGLEDFSVEDQVMPRLQIVHKEAKFEDSLSGMKYDELNVILLGLIKQRIMWAVDVDDGDQPLCKSYDFKTGHPNQKEFPWNETPFSQGDEELSCSSCPLKEWGSHPQRDTPWCSEQHTLPLLMLDEDGTPVAPALFSLQRSGIKPSRNYLSSFAQKQRPLFTVVTRLTLVAQSRGSVDYAVPKFQAGDATDTSLWRDFAEHYKTIKAYITTPPQGGDTSSESEGDAAPATASDQSSDDSDDDDLPF